MKFSYIKPYEYTKEELIAKIKAHGQIKFISFMAVDLGNNHTDVKIPVSAFLNDFDDFMEFGIQTDGSSVNLPLIATINNARVDLIPDSSVKWTVDYNRDHYMEFVGEDGEISIQEVATLVIPSFLKHNNKYIDSRSVLKKAIENYKGNMMRILKENDFYKAYGISSFDDIADIELTTATELEFWVKTPNESIDIEELSTSQLLKEQYWKRTVGSVRTALESALIKFEDYGLSPEMGHKEVGGVKSKINNNGERYHIIEQLEVDWKYDEPMQSIDNEIVAKNVITDVFTEQSLDVSFEAKPFEGVAGNGEHHHIGAYILLKSGERINLFTAQDMLKDYLSVLGYGSLMGILKNYELINPFVNATTDSYKRLQPGYEAPVCIVASLGISPDTPSRNRTVLIDVIRDFEKPHATRFELRSPNPSTNSYLTIAACLQAMIDGCKYAVNKTQAELYTELSKNQGTPAQYLEENRRYISAHDVYEKYTEKVRNTIFGKTPTNVYEAIKIMDENEHKIGVLLDNQVFSRIIIESYKEIMINHWISELKNRTIIENESVVRACKKLHTDDYNEVSEQDVRRWQVIKNLRWELMKHHKGRPGIFDMLKIAVDDRDYLQISDLQNELNEKMKTLNYLYTEYKHKLLQ